MTDTAGNAAEIFERPNVTFPEALRAFTLKADHKKSIRIGQHHQEYLHLALTPVISTDVSK